MVNSQAHVHRPSIGWCMLPFRDAAGLAIRLGYSARLAALATRMHSLHSSLFTIADRPLSRLSRCGAMPVHSSLHKGERPQEAWRSPWMACRQVACIRPCTVYGHEGRHRKQKDRQVTPSVFLESENLSADHLCQTFINACNLESLNLSG